MVMKLSELYIQTRNALKALPDPADPGHTARDLLCFVTGKSREAALISGEEYVSDAVCRQVQDCTRRLAAGEPLAYILGQWNFHGMDLAVDRNVLIPRDDTCAVADLALGQALFLDAAPRILDLCTGSGCIGLYLARSMPDARVTLADISREALAVAKRNITAHRLSARVSCVQADALGEPPAFLGKFDMIVSNPPYVTTREMEELPVSVKDYEPHLALHGGTDGMDFYRAIARNYGKALKPGGYLCLEFGMGQGDGVCRILEENGYTIVERARDFNDRERAVLARYGKED